MADRLTGLLIDRMGRCEEKKKKKTLEMKQERVFHVYTDNLICVNTRFILIKVLITTRGNQYRYRGRLQK